MKAQRKNAKLDLQIFNDLHDWSLETWDLASETLSRDIIPYLSEKIPFPGVLLEDLPVNRGLRSIVSQKMLMKFTLLDTDCKFWLSQKQFARKYCIIVLPNLFSSEVGIIFTKEKWDDLIFRDIHEKNYHETTSVSDLPVESELGIVIPSDANRIYLDWKINDYSDGFSFNGGFLVFWKDLTSIS